MIENQDEKELKTQINEKMINMFQWKFKDFTITMINIFKKIDD
jgi:hypothetical protein